MTLLTPEFLFTKRYSAKRDRLMFAHGGAIQAGAWDAGDLKATWTSGMNLSIAAGFGLVPANNAGNLGLYHVQNDAAVTVTIPAAHASLPRLDQVYVLIDDLTDGGAADDTPAFGVVQGTATSGATLDNRTGAAALPNNALRICDVLTPAAAAALSAAAVRDRRQWARGAYNRIFRNSGSYSTSSVSAIQVDSTNLAPRVECSGAPVRVTLNARGWSPATGGYGVATGLWMDGALIDGADKLGEVFSSQPNVTGWAGYAYTTIPTPGSHVFAPTFRLVYGTGQQAVLSSSGGETLVFTVEELARPSANNN